MGRETSQDRQERRCRRGMKTSQKLMLISAALSFASFGIRLRSDWKRAESRKQIEALEAEIAENSRKLREVRGLEPADAPTN